MLKFVYISILLLFIITYCLRINGFYFDEEIPSILPLLLVPLYKDSIWISRSFLLSFRERRKSNVGGRTERLKGGVNGSISAAGRQQNTEWNLDGKTHEAARNSRISRAGKSDEFF